MRAAWRAHAGHRMELLEFHTHVLACEGGGTWTQHTAAEYGRLLQAKAHRTGFGH